MKQNERILVYLVTGFLAVILIAAVFFGQDGKASDKKSGEPAPKSFAELMGAKTDPAAAPGAGDTHKQPADAGANAGQGAPVEAVAPRSPLVAQQVPLVTERVAQYLGASSRERDWRRVTALQGDSLEALVRRWCGSRDPFLEDAISVNEDKLKVLRPGDAVLVPWVDDEKVWAAYEARQPKLLTGSSDGVVPTSPSAAKVDNLLAPVGVPQNADKTPGFRVPTPGVSGAGVSGEAIHATKETAAVPAAGTVVYIVKDKDSLWKIAAGIRGKGQADKVLGEIRQLNPGLSDRLQVNQKLVVPAR